MARIVVIGAGIGGLAVAARLAAAGHTVTVCERAGRAGGKLGTVTHRGFRFDTGPSLLTLPHVFADLFAATGAPLSETLELVPVSPIARYRYADGTVFDVDGGTDPVAFGAAAVHGWRRLDEAAAAAWPAVYDGVLSAPAGHIPRAGAAAVLRMAPWRSLSGLARRRFADPRLRAYLERYATYAGADPRRASAMLAVIPYIERRYGAWHIRGGLHRLAEALVARCPDVRLGVGVRAIEVSGGRASGVLLDDGSRLAADVVVANADPGHVRRDLLGRPEHEARPSLSGFVLLLGLRGRTPGQAHHTVLFPADYHAEFDAIFARRPGPAGDPTIYVCAPDDPAMRPAGHEGWFVLVNAAAHGTGRYRMDWTAPGVAEAYRDRILDALAVRDRLLFCTVRTPADLARDTGAPGGAIYGPALRGPWRDLRRPPNRTSLPNLFLVGGSVHPGGGLPLVALSAAIVARHVGPA